MMRALAMGRDQAIAVLLPMGSIVEAMQFLVFELPVHRLRDHLGEAVASVRALQTNLEWQSRPF